MNALTAMTPEEIVTLLGKNWMTHDGMWFYHCFENFGIEAANNLNKAAIATLATIEMARFLKAFSVKKEDLQDETVLKEFLKKVAAFLIPEFMNVAFDFSGKKEIYWEFNEKKCFAFNGISLLGVIDRYECGPLFRIRCWLEALNIPHTMHPDVQYCVMPVQGKCTGVFKIF